MSPAETFTQSAKRKRKATKVKKNDLSWYANPSSMRDTLKRKDICHEEQTPSFNSISTWVTPFLQGRQVMCLDVYFYCTVNTFWKRAYFNKEEFVPFGS